MKVFQSGKNTLHIANQNFRESRNLKSLKDLPLEIIVRFIVTGDYRRLGIGYDDYHENAQKFLDFCKRLSHTRGDFKVGILDAHGSGEWYYKDGFTKKPVQRWIDEHDGVYNLLLLHVCNPKHIRPIIKKSLAVVPTDTFNMLSAAYGDEHLLVIPNKGAVPFNYRKINRLPSYNLLKGLQLYVPSRQ